MYLFRRPHTAYKHRGCCTASSPQHHGVSVLRSSLGMDHPGPLARAPVGTSRTADRRRQRHEHRRDVADVRRRGFRGVLRRSVFRHTHLASWRENQIADTPHACADAGIPFAEPPLGDLRFAPPVELDSLGVPTFNATAFGAPCVQFDVRDYAYVRVGGC